MLRVYDTARQLLQQKEIVIETGKVISQFDFEYDAAGNIIKEKNTIEPDIDINLEMTYAVANRLATYDGSGVQFYEHKQALDTVTIVSLCRYFHQL
jgi:hypothetical protein